MERQNEHFINWVEQSRLHSPFFKNGRIEVPLPNGKTVLLTPGPAFGDASHPTTRLSLKLLLPLVENKTVLDIGTGSGILALSAALMGAKKCVGVEIDPDALQMAQANKALNKLDNVQFTSEVPNETFDIIVANMTLGDQKIAFPSYQKQFTKASTLVISGLLEGQQEEILAGWAITQVILDESWVACCLSPCLP